MDKNTLGHYGWVVITVIIISIMIALASPFAGMVKENYIGTINDFDDKLSNALDEMKPKEFIYGLYQTGALSLHNTNGPEAITDMLITPWNEMVSNGTIVVADGYVYLGTVAPDDLPEMNKYGFYYGVKYGLGTEFFVFNEDGTADLYTGEVLAYSVPAEYVIYNVGSIDMSAIIGGTSQSFG